MSHRELDASRSTPQQPWLLHRREQKLGPGEIVLLVPVVPPNV